MADSDNDDKKTPSKWGKGKTDPDTWWPKGGPSPNPWGRPKGSKNQRTLYKEAFEKKVEVAIDGEPKTMMMKEAGYHQVARKSAGGDLKAFQIQKELDEKFEPPDTTPPTAEESAADFQTLDQWIAVREKFRMFEMQEEGDEEVEGEDEEEEDDEDDGGS